MGWGEAAASEEVGAHIGADEVNEEVDEDEVAHEGREDDRAPSGIPWRAERPGAQRVVVVDPRTDGRGERRVEDLEEG